MKWMRLIMPAYLLCIPVTVVAGHSYTDVPSDAWFSRQVGIFADQGYLDTTQSRFRPGDFATRAELIKLIVLLNGGVLDDVPDTPTFSDVSHRDWFSPYIEDARREGWVKGDGDCAGSMPCFVRPYDPVSRAEAAALITRAFSLRLGDAPVFADVSPEAWYAQAIQSAAHHCLLRGDGGGGMVRPADNLNRAEMIVLLFRIDERNAYPGC